MIRKFQYIIANKGLEGESQKKAINSSFKIFYINKINNDTINQVIDLNPAEFEQILTQHFTANPL